MGRAVVAGVSLGASDADENKCGISGVAAYVPHFLNWILDTIKE